MKSDLSFRTLSSLLPFLASVALAACGASAEAEAESVNALAGASGAEPSASAQAYKGGASANPGVVDANTMQQALTALTANVDLSVDAFKLAAAGGKASVSCLGGGDANVAGYMNMVPAPTAIDVNVSIAFSGCATRNGTMVDGNIDFSQTLATSPDATTAFQVETIYEGDVNLSGDVNVSCPVDLNVLVDQTGRALEVQGRFCNQDAADLAMQLHPLWQSE